MDNDCEIRKRDGRAVQMTGEVMCKSQDEVCITAVCREEGILPSPPRSAAAEGDENCEVCVWVLGGAEPSWLSGGQRKTAHCGLSSVTSPPFPYMHAARSSSRQLCLCVA